MADLLKAAILQLMTPECYDQYFVNYNFFHGECMKSTLSKVMGTGIVVASLGVKIPQILKIYQSKSGEGVSLLAVFLELVAITSFFLYSYVKNFPFSAWGEGPTLGLQTAAILGLVLHYRKERRRLASFLSGYLAVVMSVVAGVIPFEWSAKGLWYLQVLNLPIAAVGKGIQIVSNYRRQSTGQLSVATYWMLFLGSLARIFTSVQETGDLAIILTFGIAAMLNGMTVFQCYYYAKGGGQKKKGQKGKGKGKKLD